MTLPLFRRRLFETRFARNSHLEPITQSLTPYLTTTFTNRPDM